MTIGLMLSNLILGPLKLLMEVIFALANRILDTGMSIVVLSLTVNILVLPLYRRADAIQKESQRKEAMLADRVKRIKAAFKGDEQYMILQTYYRQNHYSPLYALRGALPLLLQIPFFIAAYQFLSRLGSLQNASLGPIQDLSQPDRLLQISGMTLNLLPILMTAINLLSGALYLNEAPLKTKIQTMGMALVFLVLLYGSPAGLTFYWTLNNLFSLMKNILARMFPGKKATLPVPNILSKKPCPGLFFLCAALLAILTGLLIPSAVLAASPQEFIEYITDLHPVWYAVQSGILATGTFVLWLGVYYALVSNPVKKAMEIGVWVLFGIFLVNYLFFRNNLGTISSTLKYDRTPTFSTEQKLVNLAVLLPVSGGLILLLLKKEQLVRSLAMTTVLVMCCMGVRNLWIVGRSAAESYRVMERNYSGAEEIPISRTGKNVVLLMLDRAVSSYIPCILYEKPELKEIYSGFVYYPNTLSFGMHTNLGSPALFGGYEYTPSAMNARDSIPLRDKHNEALLLLPTLFSQQGYKVSVFDMPYPGNYTEAGDYTIYDDLPDTNARQLYGQPDLNGIYETAENIRLRNFFCYSISMTVPTALYGTVYSMGSYNQARQSATMFSVKGDRQIYTDYEIRPEFMTHYEVLKKLPEMTRLQEDGNTLLVMVNRTSHAPTLLKEPEYIPGDISGNAAYDEAHADRFLAGPLALSAEGEYQMAHYDVNMAAILLVGDWLEQLKEMGVYDNTRIIIVSDHGGYSLQQITEGILDSGEDIMGYNPLLMVKDFGATGEIITDTSFMTNADAPSLAMDSVIENPVNPFTGKAIDCTEKEKPQYVSISHSYEVAKNHGTTFNSSPWYKVMPGGETLFDTSRWIYQEE